MVGLKGSYLGFTFNNIHSSKLGITRTFEGDRFNINLLPDLVEKVTDGLLDGQNYWGTTYSKREFNVTFAFDGLTEEQLRQVKKIFNDKKIHDLIFDEEPYKIWSAKLTGVAMHKHICFSENGKKVYKGEGTYVFTCPYSLARSRFQFIEDYIVDNIREWIDDNENKYLYDEELSGSIIYPAEIEYFLTKPWLSGAIRGEYNQFAQWLEQMNALQPVEDDLIQVNSNLTVYSSRTVYDNYFEWVNASQLPSGEEYGGYENGQYKIYNAGDVNMPFRALYKISDITSSLVLSLGTESLTINRPTAKARDEYICIDVRENTIRGYDSNKKPTKNLYNKYITNGKIFDIPIGEQILNSSIAAEKLEYHYLYL